jgi:hypothetical protein
VSSSGSCRRRPNAPRAEGPDGPHPGHEPAQHPFRDDAKYVIGPVPSEHYGHAPLWRSTALVVARTWLRTKMLLSRCCHCELLLLRSEAPPEYDQGLMDYTHASLIHRTRGWHDDRPRHRHPSGPAGAGRRRRRLLSGGAEPPRWTDGRGSCGGSVGGGGARPTRSAYRPRRATR